MKQSKTIIGVLFIIASTLVGVTTAEKKDGVVENDMSSVAIDTTSNLRGRRITTNGDQLWVNGQQNYFYDFASFEQSMEDGGKLIGAATVATQITGDGVPFVVRAHFQHDSANPLLPSVTADYSIATDESFQKITLISGDKTMELIVMNSKIKKIVINGEEVPARAVKPIRKLNLGLAGIAESLPEFTASLTVDSPTDTVYFADLANSFQLAQEILN